jgi:hypothetical protein
MEIAIQEIEQSPLENKKVFLRKRIFYGIIFK